MDPIVIGIRDAGAVSVATFDGGLIFNYWPYD